MSTLASPTTLYVPDRSLSLEELMMGHRIACLSEGKSQHTIAIIEAALRRLAGYLRERNMEASLVQLGPEELRGFSVYLHHRPRYACHPFTKAQPQKLSGHTVNGYMRALRAFWSWLSKEGLITENPFDKVKVPKAPKKVIPVFTNEHLQRLFSSIDTRSATGFRDYAVMLTLLDTGIRCSELINLELTDLDLQNRLLRVKGKGAKERLVPFGSRVQKALWKYIRVYRTEPATPNKNRLFLTRAGYPLSKDRLEAIVEQYGKRAGVSGVRVSPHTFRHTMAISFLRNGGDVFSLQQILGHSTLEVLRGYINLALSDISRVHQRSSPADNLDLRSYGTKSRRKGQRMLKADATDL